MHGILSILSMKSFKFVCARDNQRSEFIVRYNTLEEAKNDLHKQGYTIIEAQEVEESSSGSSKNIFYFEIEVSGQKKLGQIEGEDIFKCYTKLVEVYKYTILAIYQDRDTPENEKKIITKKLQEYYDIYLKQKTTKDKKTQDTDAIPHEVVAAISPAIMKDIQRYYAIIDRILARLNTINTTYQ